MNGRAAIMLSAIDGPTPGSDSSSDLLAVLILTFFDFESAAAEVVARVVLLVTFSLLVTRCAAVDVNVSAMAATTAAIQLKRIFVFIRFYSVPPMLKPHLEQPRGKQARPLNVGRYAFQTATQLAKRELRPVLLRRLP